MADHSRKIIAYSENKSEWQLVSTLIMYSVVSALWASEMCTPHLSFLFHVMIPNQGVNSPNQCLAHSTLLNIKLVHTGQGLAGHT